MILIRRAAETDREDIARVHEASIRGAGPLNSVSFYETCGFRVTGETQYRTRGGLVMTCALMEKSLR